MEEEREIAVKGLTDWDNYWREDLAPVFRLLFIMDRRRVTNEHNTRSTERMLLPLTVDNDRYYNI